MLGSARSQYSKAALAGYDGSVFLEFDVPRIGSRIDAVLVAGPAVFVIEFKVGRNAFNTHDFNQAWDYALDLKNFHLGSHDAPILPVLVATEAEDHEPNANRASRRLSLSADDLQCGTLGQALRLGLAQVTGTTLDPLAWARAPYQPTPTIIEAAQALYARHSVDSIARHDAGARNLGITSDRVEEIIDLAREDGRKAIVFVTGVPGAGKTLVGLNVATKKRDDTPTHAVFLSGNGPLVKVLREALGRDEMIRLRAKNDRTRKGAVRQKIKAFIQNVHHFRDEGLNQEGPPTDRVVIFDEAQRAWNREMTADFMRRRRVDPGLRNRSPSSFFRIWIATRIGQSWSASWAADKKSTAAKPASLRG